MCTAATYTTKNHYFGRTLDYEYSYEEQVTVTTRNYPFPFRKVNTMETHYAMIGMAFVVENYPLYYGATNEKGLSMAGLNFPGIRNPRVSASFSIFWVRLPSREVARILGRGSMRLLFILPAAIRIKAFIIIQPMRTARLPEWICIKIIWTGWHLLHIHW